jgi:hypothetical protein
MVKRWLAFLMRHNDQIWRRRGSKPFKDFFAQSVEAKLRKGRPHRSLGGDLFGREYGKTGSGLFRQFVSFGLKPGNVCVDYGCGTLRLGVHAINYLNPRCYWGLDISDFLLQEGRKLIGDTLWLEKQPNLRVISPDTIAEVAAASPTMLFSTKVLIHVHPDELPEYFRNIMKIIGASGQAIITGKWSEGETIRYSQMSWAHAVATIRKLVGENGGEMQIVSAKECQLDNVVLTAKSGMLRIVAHPGIAHS